MKRCKITINDDQEYLLKYYEMCSSEGLRKILYEYYFSINPQKRNYVLENQKLENLKVIIRNDYLKLKIKKCENCVGHHEPCS